MFTIRIYVSVEGLGTVAAWDVDFEDDVDTKDPMFIKTMLETESMLLERFIHTEWKVLNEQEDVENTKD